VHAVRIDEVLCGRYALKSRLGEGGMGTVYLAHDKELDREVAVKLLAATLVNDAEVVERFEREARLTAKLDHPNIVPIYDVGRHEGRPFMVMKKLEGVTLAGLLREKGGLSAEETLKLLRQLASGLDYIHGKGFIHRDIKAGNIFVGPEGHATLLDFGILRHSHASDGLTKTGVVMGTPHYMAPEQAIGSKNVDHRVDIYALAVVLFECLTGTLPFDADSELRLIQLQAHAPPPDLLERAPWIQKPIAEVMKRALAKRPEDRFSTGSEMLKALEVAYASAAKTTTAPQAPAQYRGPPVAPGTAPSWRRRESGEQIEKPPPMPTPVPSVPIVQTPLGSKLKPPEPPPPPPSRVPLFIAAVVVLSGIVALVAKPWEGPVVVVTPSADAGQQVVAAEVPDATVAAAELVADAAVAIAAAAVDAGKAVVAAPVPVPVRRGSVNVISMHGGEMFWGEVFLDGVEKGRTPLTLDLMPGKYQLRVERHGFKTQERQINVASGRSIVERFDLAP